MGVNIQRRGFSDANVYMAYNTQDKIFPAKVGKYDKFLFLRVKDFPV